MGLFDLFKKKKKNPDLLNPVDESHSNSYAPRPVSFKPAEQSPSSVEPAHPAAPVVQPPAPEKKEIIVPSVINGKKLKYHYDHVDFFIPDDLNVDLSVLNPGDDIALVSDPKNPHDSTAVAVSHPIGKLGYLYRNKLYDMTNDWFRYKLPVYSHIDSIDDDNRKVTLFIAYYGSSHSSKKTVYKLTGSKNKAAQETIELLDEGSDLLLDYDPEKEKCFVTYLGDIVGALPKNAEQHYDDVVCTVDHIDSDENGKYDVFVYFE